MQTMVAYVSLIAVLWFGFDADTRGNCTDCNPCSSLFENDFFVATAPIALALVVIAAWDALRPGPRPNRLSAVVFALGIVMFGLLSFGIVGDTLDDLRGAQDVLIIK